MWMMFAGRWHVAIRKPRLDRKVDDLAVVGDNIVHLPAPWSFVIECRHHGSIEIDFTPLRANDRHELASHFRDAVWGMRHTRLGVTLKQYRAFLTAFFRFLNEIGGTEIKCLSQISRHVLDAYIAWLGQQLRVRGSQRGLPWAIGSQMAHYNAVKSLLKHLRRWVPHETRSLSFPRNPFPNSARRMSPRQSYSEAESQRLLVALNQDLRALHSGEHDIKETQILGIHLLVLGLATGRNQQSVLELPRDCLQPHAAPGRKLLVTSKRRGYSTHVTSLRSSDPQAMRTEPRDVVIPNNVAEHIEWLADHTAPLALLADERYTDRIFLRIPSNGKDKGKVVPMTASSVNATLTLFVRRHGLQDDHGNVLALCFARLRPTFGNAIYARSGGDLRAVQKALNHADLRTTVNHYLALPPHAERDHALVVEGMVGWAKREIEGKVMIAADGSIPLANVENLLSGGYNTGVARCRNPFRENESVCSKFFTCFKCQNMVVFEDDLWRLYSFYYRLLHERIKIAPHHWSLTYGPIIRRIDAEIAPQFPAAAVELARSRAQREPHPMWRGPLL